MPNEGDMEEKRPRAPTFRWLGRAFKLRRFQPKDLKELDPAVASAALTYMLQDYAQIAYLGMAALAKDLYARQPDGPREFERFVQTLGLRVVDAEGKVLPLADLLKNP